MVRNHALSVYRRQRWKLAADWRPELRSFRERLRHDSTNSLRTGAFQWRVVVQPAVRVYPTGWRLLLVQRRDLRPGWKPIWHDLCGHHRVRTRLRTLTLGGQLDLQHAAQSSVRDRRMRTARQPDSRSTRESLWHDSPGRTVRHRYGLRTNAIERRFFGAPHVLRRS